LKNLIFGITSLTLGGAERVLIDIVNELSNKYNITIFVLYSGGELEKQLNSNVKLIKFINKSYNELSRKEKLKISFKLLISRRKIYNTYIKNKYNTEIAFLEGPITRLFSVKNSNVKKIAWVHNDISKVFGKNIKAIIKKKLDKIHYMKYNNIIFVSNDNMEKFKKLYKCNNNMEVIHNYISCDRVKKQAENIIIKDIFNKEDINFLTVVRLTKQKAIDWLIRAHVKLIEQGFYHKIYIIGDGPERNKLQEMINKYNIQTSFILLGKMENPYPYIKKCDIFALLSEYEGYGMVLEEAKILGKPIIITDTAAREAVVDYQNAIIVSNNEDGIIQGIKQCIELDKSNVQEYNNNFNILEKIEKLVN